MIVVTRVHISINNTSRKTILKQFLSQREKAWFQSRVRDLELNANHEDIQSLIAFNVMKESFSDAYIQKTTQGIMEGLRPNEEKLLQHLSLINTFNADAVVPKGVFDELLGSFASSTKKYSTKELKVAQKPVGLVDFCMPKSTKRLTWTANSTESLELLIKHRNTTHDKCIAIVSPLIANSMFCKLMEKYQLSHENVVDQLLDYSNEQRNSGTNSSDMFVAIVCNLFKERERVVTENGEEKQKFSNLVLRLDSVAEGETENECRIRTNRLMKKCFEISDDPYVGQQRARYCIYVHEFKEAKEAIQASITRLDKVPILYDTYAQAYKGELEFVLKQSDLAAVSANDVIELTTNAITMFRKAQELDKGVDTTSLLMEVRTALFMLENISKLPCFKEKRDMFFRFLNEQNTGFFAFMLPQIEGYRKGNDIQCHVEESLLYLDYEFSMRKRSFSQMSNQMENENSLRKLKERFSCIYTEHGRVHGSTYGVSYKSIKDAFHHKRTYLGLQSAVEDVRRRVRKNYFSNPKIKLFEQETDLMRFVGFNIIKLSLARQNEGREDVMTDEDFKKLLSATEVLVRLQTNRLHTTSKWKPYIEPFMYIGLLHWPLPKRLDIHEEEICEPERFSQILNEWKEVYDQRLERGKKPDQPRRGRPTTFFALADGPPGMDIVDQDMIRRMWRREKKNEGRYRKEVKQDDIWNHPIGQATYIRLKGVVDGTGNNINHEVKHVCKKSNEMLIWHFDIPTNDNCHIFRNRKVSFILGFSWRGPVAYGVAEDFPVQVNEQLQESLIDRENETANEVQTPTNSIGRGRGVGRGCNQTGGRGKSRLNVTLKNPGDCQKTASVSQHPYRQHEESGQFADGTDEENVIAAAADATCYPSQPVSETPPEVQAEQSGGTESKKLSKRQRKNLNKKGK